MRKRWDLICVLDDLITRKDTSMLSKAFTVTVLFILKLIYLLHLSYFHILKLFCFGTFCFPSYGFFIFWQSFQGRLELKFSRGFKGFVKEITFFFVQS